MRGIIIFGKDGNKTYKIDGNEVTAEEFELAFPSQPVSGTRISQFKPMASEALAYHPDQLELAEAHLKKIGVPTEIDKLGRPIIRTRQHRRELFAKLKIMDRNSYSGY
jgi:hypothetical protein